MDATIRHRPSYGLLSVALDPGEAVTAEAGALVGRTAGIDIATRTEGGLLRSVKRRVFGGESLFLNRFTAREPGTVLLAPPLPGDVSRNAINDEVLVLQAGSFLATVPGVEVDARFGGARSLLGGEGLFLLELEGTGPVFMAAYGAIENVVLDAGETYVVDSGHLVGFEEQVDVTVTTIGGLKSTLFGGEGLALEFEGPGRVWLQSRNQEAFVEWLLPRLADAEEGGRVRSEQ